MGQIFLDYGLLKEIVVAIMMLYKNTKVKVRSSHGDTDFFYIVASVLQGDTLVSYLLIICLDYVLNVDRFNERNGFTLEKIRSRWYPTQTITDTNYADDIALLANTHALAESLLHILDKAAGSIGLHVNADKTGDISTLKGGSL